MKIGKSNPLESKFTSSEVKREALLKYSELVLNAISPSKIYQDLYDEFGFDMNQSLHFYNEVKDTIAEAVVENNDQIVSNHLELYEEVYRRCWVIDDARGMMKSMKQKEELLKLFETESTEVVVNQQTNIFGQASYDVERLDSQKKNRLTELLEKATK